MNIDLVKTKIEALVKDYKDIFPNEYALACMQIREKRNQQVSDFAEVDQKAACFIERALVEYPETLYYLFESRLQPDEFAEFTNNKKVIRWFARRFPEFKVAQRI